jgi:hypothetical protein
MAKKKKNKSSPYEDMVLGLSYFVVRASNKDNPSPSELNAMVEIAKLLFKTI